jgi:hypothetical protein
MAPQERRAIQLDDDENGRLHAAWSRSGKHLIVTAASQTTWDRFMQVELRPDQVADLVRFLSETVDLQPGDR